MHQLVVGRTENGVARIRPEARAVDQALRMLNAKANRKRLWLNVDATLMQHLEGVTRTVANGEDDLISGQRFSIDVDNGYIDGKSAVSAKITVKYFDMGTDSWSLKYDANSGEKVRNDCSRLK